MNKNVAKIFKDYLKGEDKNMKSLTVLNWTRCKATFIWIINFLRSLLLVKQVLFDDPRENKTLIRLGLLLTDYGKLSG